MSDMYKNSTTRKIANSEKKIIPKSQVITEAIIVKIILLSKNSVVA
jgi:hypothetical protein